MCLAEKIEAYQSRIEALKNLKDRVDEISGAIVEAIGLARQIQGENFFELFDEINKQILTVLSPFSQVDTPLAIAEAGTVEAAETIAPAAEPKKRGRRPKTAELSAEQDDTGVLFFAENTLCQEFGLSRNIVRKQAVAAFSSGDDAVAAFCKTLGWNCVQFPYGEEKMARAYWSVDQPIPEALEEQAREAFAERFRAIASKDICEAACFDLFRQDMASLSNVQMNKLFVFLSDPHNLVQYKNRGNNAEETEDKTDETEDNLGEESAQQREPNVLRRQIRDIAASQGLSMADINATSVQMFGAYIDSLNASQLERLLAEYQRC